MRVLPLLALCLSAILGQCHGASGRHPSEHSSRRQLAFRMPEWFRTRSGFISQRELKATLRAALAVVPAKPYLTPAVQIAPVCQEPGATQLLNMKSAEISARVWKGWGTSLGWYANFLGSLSGPQRKTVLDRLFDKKKGLGLNIVRYNIPGGFNRTLSPQFNRTDNYKWRAMAGFKPTAKGPYDWTADSRQRTALKGARNRGVTTFIAFSRSPPWYLTVSGDVAGGVNGVPNLRDNATQAYADYLADVVQQFKTKWNITFSTLEPMDQPGTKFKSGGLQEGCGLTTDLAAKLISAVAASLKKRSLLTDVAAFNEFPENLGTWGGAMPKKPVDVPALIKRFSTNGYETTTLDTKARVFDNAKDYVKAEQAARFFNKEIWVSDWNSGITKGSDLGVALYMSRQIISSVSLIKATAWIYWQPLDIVEDWGLINVNWNATAKTTLKTTRTKKYWALMQFTQTVPKGSVPIELEDVRKNRCIFCVTAFFVPCKNQLVVVGVNQQIKKDQQIQIAITGFTWDFGGKKSQHTLYRTSEKENFKAQPKVAWNGTTLSLNLQERSLTTVVLSNVMSKDALKNKCPYPKGKAVR